MSCGWLLSGCMRWSSWVWLVRAPPVHIPRSGRGAPHPGVGIPVPPHAAKGSRPHHTPRSLLTGWGGKQLYDEIEHLEKDSHSNSHHSTSTDVEPETTVDVSGKEVLYILLFTAGMATILSGLWVTFLIRCAKSFIIFTILFKVVISVGMGIGLYILTKQIALLIIWCLAGCLGLLWYCCVRKRLAFAGANVEVGAGAVGLYPATLFTAFGALLASFVWVALWSTAVAGIFVTIINKDMAQQGDSQSRLLAGTTSDDPGHANNGGTPEDVDPSSGAAAKFTLLTFVMLISFYWGVQVCRNVLHTTIAGTVGTWWRQARPESPTYGALCRAMTTSFGTIALGSLIIAIIQALKAMVRNARRNSQGGARVALACLQCCIGCIERLAEYFTSYAFVMAALYGTTFYQSASRVMSLFRDRGFTTIINDVIVDRALGLGVLLVALANAGLGVAFGLAFGKEGTDAREVGMVIGGVLGFIFGLGLCSIVTSVIHSAVQTVYVCWAEAPEALADTHPEEFGKLLTAWMEAFPSVMQKAGYDRFTAPGGAVPVAAPVGPVGKGGV